MSLGSTLSAQIDVSALGVVVAATRHEVGHIRSMPCFSMHAPILQPSIRHVSVAFLSTPFDPFALVLRLDASQEG